MTMETLLTVAAVVVALGILVGFLWLLDGLNGWGRNYSALRPQSSRAPRQFKNMNRPIKGAPDTNNVIAFNKETHEKAARIVGHSKKLPRQNQDGHGDNSTHRHFDSGSTGNQINHLNLITTPHYNHGHCDSSDRSYSGGSSSGSSSSGSSYSSSSSSGGSSSSSD